MADGLEAAVGGGEDRALAALDRQPKRLRVSSREKTTTRTRIYARRYRGTLSTRTQRNGQGDAWLLGRVMMHARVPDHVRCHYQPPKGSSGSSGILATKGSFTP